MLPGHDLFRRKTTVRRPFTPHEDAALIVLIGSNSDVNWDDVARRTDSPSARQRRERWVEYLAPTLRSDPWTEAEDQLLIGKINDLGHCLAAISHCFNGRSENDVKNRWYSHLKFRSNFHPVSQVITLMSADSCSSADRKKRTRVKRFPQHAAMKLLERGPPTQPISPQPGTPDCLDLPPVDASNLFEFEEEKNDYFDLYPSQGF
jgi:hypothetical protein